MKTKCINSSIDCKNQKCVPFKIISKNSVDQSYIREITNQTDQT